MLVHAEGIGVLSNEKSINSMKVIDVRLDKNLTFRSS
jgi:hypothetical protein